MKLGLDWAKAIYVGRNGSAGAAVGFGDAFEDFLDEFPAAKPDSFLANLAGYF
jgi:hypothetical protein